MDYMLIVYSVIGMVLIGLEIFVPGWILGLTGVGLMIYSITTAFHYSSIYGFSLLVFSLLGSVISVLLSMKYLPSSRFGKKLIHDDQLDSSSTVECELKIGDKGVAHTVLRPSGTAIFYGNRYDVLTQGDHIEKDTPIKVVEVHGTRIFVCKAD